MMNACPSLTDPPETIEAAISPTTKPAASSNITKQCPACGGTDHQRKSSKKCPFYVRPLKTAPVAASTPPPLPEMDATLFDFPALFDSVSVLTGETSSPTKRSVLPGVDDTNFSRPLFVNFNSESDINKKYSPDVDASSFRATETSFKLIGKDHRNREIELVPTVCILMEVFFLDTLVRRIIMSKNNYIRRQKMKEPTLHV